MTILTGILFLISNVIYFHFAIAHIDENIKPLAHDKDWPAVGIVVSAGILGLLGSCLAMYLGYRRKQKADLSRKKHKEEIYQRGQLKARPAHEPLLEAAKVRDTMVVLLEAPSVLNEATLKQWGGVAKFVDDYKKLLRGVDSKLTDNDLMELPLSLTPEIRVRRNTQVSAKVGNVIRYLNMNQLCDYVGDKILSGQQPADLLQLETYWHVIWNQKVGVMVWIGNSRLQGDVNLWFDSPAPVDAWRSEDAVWKMDPFEITVVESYIQRDPNSYFIHRIKVTKKLPNGHSETRHLTAIYIERWDNTLGRAFEWDNKPAFIKMLVDALSFVHYLFYEKQKSDQIKLPTLLVNCPSGVHQSATFVILHICRQMLLHYGKIRVESVVKYYRSHRYGAWDLSDDDLFSEIRIVHRSIKMMLDRLNFQTGYA